MERGSLTKMASVSPLSKSFLLSDSLSPTDRIVAAPNLDDEKVLQGLERLAPFSDVNREGLKKGPASKAFTTLLPQKVSSSWNWLSDYEALEWLNASAESGQAECFILKNRATGETRFIKFPRHDKPHFSKARWTREINALKKLNGAKVPGVPYLLDSHDETDVFCIAQSFIAKLNLARYLDKAQAQTFTMTYLTRAISACRSLINIVTECHKLGIRHRDIKPMNIVFDGVQDPVLVDFGTLYCPDDQTITKIDEDMLLGTIDTALLKSK